MSDTSPCNHRFVFGQSACQECGVDFPLTLPNLPLSPIALDFEAAEKAALYVGAGVTQVDTRKMREHLSTQLRAIVARVAQEEREKCAKGLEAKAEEVFDEPIAHHDLYRLGLSDGYAEAIAFLRGTP